MDHLKRRGWSCCDMWPSATDRDGHQPRGWDVVQWGGPRDTYWRAGGPRVLRRTCQAGVGAASGFKWVGPTEPWARALARWTNGVLACGPTNFALHLSFKMGLGSARLESLARMGSCKCWSTFCVSSYSKLWMFCIF